MSDAKKSIHERMAEGHSANVHDKTEQALRDDERRNRHFQVRLDSDLAKQLRHYANQRHNGVVNMALTTIVSKFFNGSNGSTT